MIKCILNNLSLFNKIKKFNKCLTRLISRDAIRFDPFSRKCGYDDGVQGYQID